MKKFEKWLDTKHYDLYFSVVDGGLTKSYNIKKRGEDSHCKVVFDLSSNRGGIVIDDNGFKTKCKNVNEIKELVDFLVCGIC